MKDEIAVHDISSLVGIVRDFSRQPQERHDAFAALVKRYQDMAFGCAYAVLGDFYLAEDCAQEAFITAWQNLGQLRIPEAFSGWLQQIVFTKCNRVVRGKRLQIVPLELASPIASSEVDPQSGAEQNDLSRKVLAAIQSLPENERLATTLFYVNGYTQTELSDFLDVPVTTVNKRLYAARRRLKNNAALEMFRSDLQQRRPSRDDAFAEKVSARLRPFTADDWTPVWDMTRSASEQDQEAGEQWLRQRQGFNENDYVRRHYVAEHAETKQLLGYGSIEQTVYLPRYRLILVIEPRWVEKGVAELLLDRLSKDLVEVDAVTVTFQGDDNTSETQSFLKQQGFTETMRVNDLRLDLSDAPESLSGANAAANEDISISTLRQERETDPNYVRKLYDLTNAIRQDDPAQESFSPPTYFEHEVRLWLELPYVLPDGYFIAKDGNEYVGLTDLNLLDALPGGVSIGFTGVRQEYRKRGIATRLKRHSIEWARKQNFRTIRALNRPQHTVLTALNLKLGFQQRFSYVTLEKCLRNIVEVDKSLYEKYTGRYLGHQRGSELVFTVKHERGRLTLECIGQKVELFPESPTKFFSKPFYGEFTFVTDPSGAVTHLDSRVRGLKGPESAVRAAKIE